MAPVQPFDHDGIEQQVKDVIQDLYRVMVQVSSYDSVGKPSKDVLTNEIKLLSRSLQNVHTTASAPDALPSVPPELVDYVENGRNPDIYTREFVELVRRGNQLMKGKNTAFADFRDVLAKNMCKANPELREDIVRVLEATGSSRAQLDASLSEPTGANASEEATTGTPAAAATTAVNAQSQATS